MTRSVTVHIPGEGTGYYRHQIDAASTLEAAAAALAEHEKRIRTGKLAKPDSISDDQVIRVIVEGVRDPKLSFEANAPENQSYYYRVARVREWMRENRP